MDVKMKLVPSKNNSMGGWDRNNRLRIEKLFSDHQSVNLAPSLTL